ncbi:hypothetical protein Emed_006862 [Eimeria media]
MHAGDTSWSRCEGSRQRLEFVSAEEEAAAAPARRRQSRAAHLQSEPSALGAQVLPSAAAGLLRPPPPKPTTGGGPRTREEGLFRCPSSRQAANCCCAYALSFFVPAGLLPSSGVRLLVGSTQTTGFKRTSNRLYLVTTPPFPAQQVVSLCCCCCRPESQQQQQQQQQHHQQQQDPSREALVASRPLLLLQVLSVVHTKISDHFFPDSSAAVLSAAVVSASSVYVHINAQLLTLQQQQLYVHLSSSSSSPTSRLLSEFSRSFRSTAADPPPTAPQAAEEGPPGGGAPSRGPPWASSNTSTPVKVRSGSLGLDVGPLSTCTTTSQAQGPPSIGGLEPAQVEEAVCAGDSSPFRFSSNVSSSGTLDFEGPLGAAAVATVLEVGPPQGGAPLRSRAPSLSPQERLCSPTRTSSSGSSPLSSCATPPLLAAGSADSASGFSLSGSLWAGGPLLSEAAGAGGPPSGVAPHLTAGMQRPPWGQREPYPSLTNSANSAAACQQQQRLIASFGAAAAAGTQEEDTRSEGPYGGGPHRPGIRHRRRHCRQQTPWDSCNSSRGNSKVAAAAMVQQSSEEGLLLSRRAAASSAAAAGAHDLALEGGETCAAGRRSNRGRSSSLKGHLQQQQQLLWQQQQQQQQQGGEEEDPGTAACSSVSSRRSEMVVSVGSGSGSGGGVSSSNDSRLLGVCFSPPKDVWRARITVDGRQFEQQFSVKRHGFDGARLLATRWRAQMETARLFRAPTLPLP